MVELATGVVQLLVSVRLILNGLVKSMLRLKDSHLKPKSWSLPMYLAITVIRSFVYHHSTDLAALRAVTDFPLIPTIPRAVRSSFCLVGSVEVELIFPRAIAGSFASFPKSGSVVIYLHGGGFGLCNPRTHRPLTHALSAMSDSVLVVPRYRRIPESCVRDAVDDCVSVYTALVVDAGVSPHRISIAGDSAGGSLAVLTLCRIRDTERLQAPRCGILLSPWCDISHTSSFEGPETHHDYINGDVLSLMSRLAMGDGLDGHLINPMLLDLTGLPPLLIHYGELEFLRNQIRLFVKKSVADGVDVTSKEYSETVHIPHFFSSVNATGHQALLDVCQYVTHHNSSPNLT